MSRPKTALMKLGLLWLTFCSFMSAQQSPARHPQPESKLPLRDGWTLQSSAKVRRGGDVISTPRFQPAGWYAVTVPTTVVAALVKQKVYPDPDFGMNLRSIPGVTYPIGMNFSNLPMQPDSPLAASWWYRKRFVIPASFKGKSTWLQFGGINYRANIWLNGKQIAKSQDVAGAWGTYEFNITDAAKPGQANVLAGPARGPARKHFLLSFLVCGSPAPGYN